jgi:hypothetical protein
MFFIELLAPVAVDDLAGPGHFLPADMLLGPTPRMDSRTDQFGTSIGLAERRIVKVRHRSPAMGPSRWACRSM